MARLQLFYLPDDKFAVVLDGMGESEFDKLSPEDLDELAANAGAVCALAFPYEVEVL